MSQYGIDLTGYYQGASFERDVSGVTLTINPLAMTQNTNSFYSYNYMNDPLSIDNAPGGGNTFSLISNNIDPWQSYIINDNSVNDQYDLLAGTPIFWVLNIVEIRNPRMLALFNSNNSGWGHDVRWFLKGAGGRHDVSNNLNRARTSDALFTHIEDAWFQTNGASPFTSGKLAEQGGVGSLGQVQNVFARALNPYAFLNDGEGGSQGLNDWSGNADEDRCVERMFVTKEPTLSYTQDTSNFLVDGNKYNETSFDLCCEEWTGSSWVSRGCVREAVTYRSTHSIFMMDGTISEFPGYQHLGCYVDWSGQQLHDGLTFTWFTDSATVPTGNNMNKTSWEDAFQNTPTARICGAPVLVGRASTTLTSNLQLMRSESLLPDRLYPSRQYDMSCGTYWNVYPLPTGVARNWDTHIDSVGRNKAIFGYDKSQGLLDLSTINDCNHANQALSNTTSNNQLYSVDHREYWFSWTPLLENETASTDQGGSGTVNPTAIHPTSFIVNQPTCGDETEWETQIIEHEYIPAPILDPNINELFFTRVRAGNTWNANGVDKVMLYYQPDWAAAAFYNVDTSITTISCPPVYAGDCAEVTNAFYMEPKSTCSIVFAKMGPTAAISIDNYSITTTDETCTTQGTIKFEFDWEVPCDAAFFNYAPDDYSFDVKLHLSKNNTGIVTDTVIVTIDESHMNFVPSTGSGDTTGTASATISVPCGDYYNHSIEVTPMTSSMFAMGQPGQGHTWNTGSGGTTWSGFVNTNNSIACPSNPPVLTCSSTNVSCGTLGSVSGSWTGGAANFDVTLYDGSGALVSSVTNITQTNQMFAGLSAGNYQIIVQDANGCLVSCTRTVSTVGGSITVSETVVDPTHCILSNGSITLNPSGGTPGYTVVWKETTTNTTLPYTGLSASPVPSGSYSYTLTDSLGCQATGNVTVGAAPAVGLSCTPGTVGLDPSGVGLSDGYIQVSINNNSGLYAASGSTLTYLPSVCVYNSAGVQQVCNNTFAGFNNMWSGQAASMLVSGLPADTYTITASFTPHVLDSSGTTIYVPAVTACTHSCTVTLSDPGSSPAVTVGTIGTASCVPGNDGTIQLTAAGGSTSAFHHWDFTICTDAAMTTSCQTFTGTSTFGDNTTGNVHTFTGLAAGTYYATVTPCFGVNGLTCQSASPVSTIITVPQLGGPTIVLTPIHPSCPGASDGGFTEVTTGGTGPYLYQFDCDTYCSSGWQPAGGTNWASANTTALLADTYHVQVIDANGCIGNASVTLTDPPAIDFTQWAGPPPQPLVTNATCGASDGSFTFSFATGGTITAPMLWFTYNLYDSGGTLVQQQLGTGSVTNSFTGLAPDTYTLTAVDSNGCTASISVTIGIATYSVSHIKSDQGCNFPPSSDGSITVSIAPWANVPIYPYTLTWSGPGGYSNTTTIAGPGFPVADDAQTGLAVGTYTINIVDGNGCTASITETIIAGTDLQENLVVTEIPMSCPTGCGILQFVNTAGDFPLWIEISANSGATWTKVSTVSNSPATAFTSADLAPPFGVEIDNNTYYQENTPNRWCFNMGSTYHIRLRGTTSPYCPSATIIHTMGSTGYVPMVHTETITQPTCCACNDVSCNGVISNVISNGIPIPQGAAGTLMSFDWTLTLDGIQIGSQVGSVVTGGVSYVVSSTQGTPTNEEFDTIVFSGLYPGTYVFTSTDLCDADSSETWIIIDPRVYVTDIVTSQPLCAFGCDDGTIEVTASGGSSGTYQFSMDDGITWQPAVATASTSYTFTGVGSGTWNVWARDPICGVQTLFDTSDNVLTTAPGCYSDFITGIWPAGTQTTLAPLSNLNTQWVSLTNNSLPGSSDGSITVNILGGTAPYEVAVSTSSTHQACNLCTLQTAGVITPGLSQYIDINGTAVSSTGITTVASNGALVIDNLSVSLDYSGTALGAWYTIVVKDATGCFSCISKYIDNGTLGIIAIYAAEDCNCSCPAGYALIEPAPAPPALPCAGTSPDAPSFLGTFNAPNSIQQFGAANLTSTSYGGNGARLYIPSGGTATTFTAVSTADTFTKTDLGTIVGFPGQFISAGSGTVLEVALDAMMVPQAYGSIFDTRLWDIGVWPQQGPTSPATPINEWIGIPIEVSFGSPQLCILGFSADGDYKITLNCGTFLTSEFAVNGGTQNIAVDVLNFKEYVMMPVLIPEGSHTLTFWVKNNTTNASADQVAGIAFDLFQGSLASGLSTTSVFVGATTQAQLDPYYILDVNGKKITSRNLTAGTYEHDFLMGDTIGYQCASNCVIMEQGNITCLSADTADCTLPINCPEYLSDLVECLGTLTNEVYNRMITGLLENKLDVREIWLVLLTKYLIKNLNPCVTLQDLLSWAKFLEDICPDCENNFEGTRAAIDPNAGTPFGGGNGINTYDF